MIMLEHDEDVGEDETHTKHEEDKKNTLSSRRLHGNDITPI